MTRWQRLFTMIGLVTAGEAVFLLPFHVTRFFRATTLEVLDLTNTELGAIQAAYGVIAMLAYIPGGALADRYSARKLLAVSLVTTALGGIYLASFPSYQEAIILFGFWGASSILLFWAALIRATREWGGSDEQGRAFGILDGGRGLMMALLAAAATTLFTLLFPEDAAAATMDEKRTVLRTVVYAYSMTTLAAAVLVWLVVPEQRQPARTTTPRRFDTAMANIGRIVRLPAIWLQAAIVVCAYVGYKGFDNYSLFAMEWGLDEVEAAQVTALSSWMRPLAAVGAGLLADRVRASRVSIAAFVFLLASHVLFSVMTPSGSLVWLLVANVLVACAAIYGMRGVYFALFEEARIPLAVTGTAVGLVSVIGYTPDVFVTLVQGVLLDHAPGIRGHQLFFLFLAAFALVGLIASVLFERLHRPEPGNGAPARAT